MQGEDKLPKFCQQCAEPLVATPKHQYGKPFDAETGKPNPDRYYGLACPKVLRFWQRLFRSGHDRYYVHEMNDDGYVTYGRLV